MTTYTQQRGFSIVEVMVALFVIAVGIVGAMMLTAANARDISKAREAIVASGLAQEGVEIVRNVRDNNVAENNDLLDARGAFEGDHFDSVTSSYKAFCPDIDTIKKAFDASQGSRVPLCKSSNGDALYVRSVSGDAELYTHSIGGAKRDNYRRAVYIKILEMDTLNDTPKSISVVSTATWDGTAAPTPDNDCNVASKCVRTEDILTAWIELEETR